MDAPRDVLERGEAVARPFTKSPCRSEIGAPSFGSRLRPMALIII